MTLTRRIAAGAAATVLAALLACPSALGAGTGTVTGHLLAHDGTPRAGVAVSVSCSGFSATATTAADGGFTVAAVPRAEGTGAIRVERSTLTGLSWGDSGTALDLRPGRVPIAVMGSGSGTAGSWHSAYVTLTARSGDSTYTTSSVIDRGSDATAGHAELLIPGPVSLSESSIVLWGSLSQGAELPVDCVTVSPGETSSTTQ